MSTYAIGDIHGCYQPLRCLLDKIAFDPARDTLWITGDLVNRGPASLEVLRFLFSIRESIVAVLGNHDLHLLSVAYADGRQGKHDNLNAILQADDRDELLDWLRRLKIMHHDSSLGYAMVHAGIPPQWTLDKALACAQELEEVLQSSHPQHFLAHMYGNQPDQWEENLSGMDRLRLITNYFTRMRFCRADGTLDLISKDSAVHAPEGFLPWFAHSHRKTVHDKILFGHWAALEGKTNTPGVYALDGGCVWGGQLIAMRLDDEQVFSCSCNKK